MTADPTTNQTPRQGSVSTAAASLDLSHPTLPRDSHWVWWAAALAYGSFVYLMQPSGIVVMDDDFGYLRSVVQTLQQGRPWTDEFLEPWSASLSVLTALAYRATGSFELAVHGALAIFATLSFAAAMSLLVGRGLTRGAAVLFAALFLTFPTLLWKSVQFTGIALYLPCLLLALVAFEKRRWGWFFVFWGAALATRQSAVTWGLLPALELWRILRSGEERRVRRWPGVAATILASMGLFFLLRGGMNKTHAQRLFTDRMFENAPGSTALQNLGLGGLFFLCAAGLGAYVAGREPRNPWGGWRNRARSILLCAMAVPLMLFDLRTRVPTEHQLLSSDPGWLYATVALSVALVGWATGRIHADWDYVAMAMCSLFFVALRPQVWDYYFLEVGIFGFFSMTPRCSRVAVMPKAVSPPRFHRGGALVMAGFQLLFIAQLKGAMDKGYALCRLHEGAVRAKRIDPSEIAKAPFGFQGWYFQHWFAAHEGKRDLDLGGFYRYLSPGAILIGKKYSPPLHILPTFQDRPPPSDSEMVFTTRTRHLWFFDAEYHLLRFPDRPQAWPAILLPADYRAPRFPLDDAEWRALIESPRG